MYAMMRLNTKTPCNVTEVTIHTGQTITTPVCMHKITCLCIQV